MKHPQDKFTAWAKKRLVDKRLSVTGLAGQLKLARNTVSLVINHPTLMPRVKSLIKEALS